MAGILGDALQTARQFQGLASVEQQMQQQAKQSEQQKIGFEALKRYQETAQDGNPDNDAMTTALIYNTDAAKNVLAHVGIQDKRQKQDAASFAIRAASIADDPQAFNSALDSRIAYLQQSGRNPADSMRLKEIYAQNPEAAKKELKAVSAALVADGSLEKSAYELAFGKVPESMNEYQKATIELDKQRLGLEQQRIAQASTQKPGDIERNWAIYKELLKTDPAEAAKFGNAARFEPQSGDVGLQQSLADAKASGKIVAEAKANLPKVESAAKYVKGYVESVLNHDGRPWSTGLMSLAPTVRGTRQADFRKRMEQINGASFLSAFESLRGGGQITQIEGEKATTAINRMSAATNDDEFNAAAKDFLDVVDSGVKNAKDLASGKTMQPIKPDQAPAQGSSKYKIEVVQ